MRRRMMMTRRAALWWWWKRRRQGGGALPADALLTEAGAAWTFEATDDYILWS